MICSNCGYAGLSERNLYFDYKEQDGDVVYSYHIGDCPECDKDFRIVEKFILDTIWTEPYEKEE